MTSPNPTANLLVIVIASGRQAETLMHALTQNSFAFTRYDLSMFAFQETRLCLMIGLNNAQSARLMGLIEEHCQPHQEYVPVQFTPPAGFPPLSMIEARVGGALVYQLEVERFEQF
mgnify:CR=1 FL=1